MATVVGNKERTGIDPGIEAFASHVLKAREATIDAMMTENA
jgi:hypothetical protein